MESAEWPEPKRDMSGYNFLFPFYYRGRGTILAESPADSIMANKQKADRLAQRLVEKTAHLSKVYAETGFPIIRFDDPCGLLSSLAVRMWVKDNNNSWTSDPYPNFTVGLNPILDREDINGMSWLGKLHVFEYRPARQELSIRLVELNQPGDRQTFIRLDSTPGRPEISDFAHTDSYPANTQAMNFIGMVDEYLDKLDQNRLVVVRD